MKKNDEYDEFVRYAKSNNGKEVKYIIRTGSPITELGLERFSKVAREIIFKYSDTNKNVGN